MGTKVLGPNFLSKRLVRLKNANKRLEIAEMIIQCSTETIAFILWLTVIILFADSFPEPIIMNGSHSNSESLDLILEGEK